MFTHKKIQACSVGVTSRKVHGIAAWENNPGFPLQTSFQHTRRDTRAERQLSSGMSLLPLLHPKENVVFPGCQVGG